MKAASRRYGGMHLAEALSAGSPYCLVTQVRSTSRHQRTLRSLGLGKIGHSVVVPRTDSLVGALKSVTPFIVATPIDNPEQAAGVRLLGSVGRDRVARRLTTTGRQSAAHEVQATESESPQVTAGGSSELNETQAVREVLTLIRPELTDNKLDAAARVIKNLAPGEMGVHDKQVDIIHNALAAVEADTADISSGQEPPPG